MSERESQQRNDAEQSGGQGGHGDKNFEQVSKEISGDPGAPGQQERIETHTDHTEETEVERHETPGTVTETGPDTPAHEAPTTEENRQNF